MLPLALALATEEPPPTELVAVAFAANGVVAAVETRWVMDGPGFPVARLALHDTTTGQLREQFEVALREADASRGLTGATAAVRQDAAAALARDGIDLSRPATAEGCGGGRCGGGSGCAGGGVAVVVTTAPVTGETCPAGWAGEAPSVTVSKQAWTVTAGRPDCARGFAASALYRGGHGGVLVLSFEIPGHEGAAQRFMAVVGPRG